MHIGQKLGQTIPAQIGIYRDIASNISIRTNCNNRAILRRRLIDPDLIDVTADVDLSEIRVRLARSDIDVETTVSAITAIVAQLFEYNADIGPGDTVIIDTDELTVEKADGTNLRKYFDGEWYNVDSEMTEDLSYSDTEGSRDIEFVIEKEDRSI